MNTRRELIAACLCYLMVAGLAALLLHVKGII